MKLTQKNMQDFSKYSALGCDVSSKTVDFCFLSRDQKESSHEVVCNTPESLEEYATLLKQKGFNGKIVMESTGRYHEAAAVAFHSMFSEVSVINPLMAKRYHTSCIRKLKTDKADARILATMGILEPVLPLFSKTKEHLALRHLLSLISACEEVLQKLRASLSHYTEAMTVLRVHEAHGVEALRDTMKVIMKEKSTLEKSVFVLLSELPRRAEDLALLTSIPGVSPYLASITLICLSQDLGATAGSWVACAGLDVTKNDSGLKKGKGRISKRGNSYLRKRLHGAGWGAFMHYPEFRAYYDDLRLKGRSFREGMIIMSRKILRIMWSVLKYRTTYDPKKAFSV